MNPLRVLVVEDEVALAMVIGSYFEREGFDGVEVCRLVRQFTYCYVIMVTAREDEVDKVLGLSMGADDHLVKPFSPRELIARAKAMLRRPRLRIPADGMPLDLTRTEFDLLAALAARPRAAFTRAQLIESVWGQGEGPRPTGLAADDHSTVIRCLTPHRAHCLNSGGRSDVLGDCGAHRKSGRKTGTSG